jgi:glutamine amidotransferase
MQGMNPGHLDGWGASGFKEGRAVYLNRRTEPADVDRAEFTEAIARAQKAETPIVIAHFRKTSGATPAIANTHPFHWRDWVFAHQGTIFGAEASLPLNETAPLGETDSERFFLFLWEQVHASADPTATMAAFLKKSRESLVFSSLNFLMSDGQTLWAYRDVGDKRLEKGETRADREGHYTLFTAALDKTALVCSEPLASLAKNWEPVAQRTLLAFTAGKATPQIVTI